VLQPFASLKAAGPSIFLANNDYVAQNVYYLFGDWAEESLLQSERALRRLGTPKPAWLDQAYYNAQIVSRDPL